MKTNDFPALPGSNELGGVVPTGPPGGKQRTEQQQQEDRAAGFLEVVKGVGKLKVDSEGGEGGCEEVHSIEDSSQEVSNHR
jgi:hypothetical protein